MGLVKFLLDSDIKIKRLIDMNDVCKECDERVGCTETKQMCTIWLGYMMMDIELRRRR